jgi:predicted enzyme related to lactoylglutathione lyase
VNHLPGKFVWFEHLSSDLAKARAFYSALLGWTFEPMHMGEQPYDIIMNGSEPRGIGGFRAAAPGMPSHWSSYLSVADVDTSYAKATATGAQSLLAPMEFGTVGRGCAIADPGGAAVCLWKGAQGDPADTEKTPIGGWFWNELFSKDVQQAVAFYEKLLGFTHDEMDMGPQGTYYILKDASGRMRGGAMQQPPGTPIPSNWQPYIHVADCDATVAKAARLGAQSIMMPPTDIPNIGRFAVIMDPVGAAIAVITGVGSR